MTDIKLIEATPEYAGQLRQFRKEVFEHAISAGFDLPVQKAGRCLTIQYAGAIIIGKSAETRKKSQALFAAYDLVRTLKKARRIQAFLR